MERKGHYIIGIAAISLLVVAFTVMTFYFGWSKWGFAFSVVCCCYAEYILIRKMSGKQSASLNKQTIFLLLLFSSVSVLFIGIGYLFFANKSSVYYPITICLLTSSVLGIIISIVELRNLHK